MREHNHSYAAACVFSAAVLARNHINGKGASGFEPSAPILVAGVGFEPTTFGL